MRVTVGLPGCYRNTVKDTGGRSGDARDSAEPLSEKQFLRYHSMIVEWNRRVNLTSVTEWTDVQSRHFLDSLSVSAAIPPDMLQSGRFVDVGSGAGLPGVPLKIAFPGLRPTLIESTGKKTAFLAEIASALGLRDLTVCTGRAEDLAREPDLRESFDFAVARAVAGMSTLAELTLPFCRIGGIVIAQKKLDARDEIEEAESAIEAVGGRLLDVQEVFVEGLEDSRGLVVLEKVRATPMRYPRRPGIPAKRPLG